jgi:hypothetical protein
MRAGARRNSSISRAGGKARGSKQRRQEHLPFAA